MNTCDIEIAELLKRMNECEVVEGASMINTTCLYPDNDLINLYIYKSTNDKYVITDDGNTLEKTSIYFKDKTSLRRSASKFAEKYYFKFDKNIDAFFTESINIDEVENCIVFMANMLQSYAYYWNEKRKISSNNELKERLYLHITRNKNIPDHSVIKEYEIPGESNRKFVFDYAIIRNNKNILLECVNNHQGSIASSYLKFNDVHNRDQELIREAFIADQTTWKSSNIRLIRSVSENVNFIEDHLQPFFRRYDY